jgi:uncharacterized membrane protein YGL010W
MKSAIEQLSSYKSVHLNRKNIRTHFIGIPMIIWSIALLMANVSFDIESSYISDFLGIKALTLTLAGVFSIIVLIYYLLLSFPLAILSTLLFGPLIWSVHEVIKIDHHIIIAISVFVLGWIIQFIGHYYEKAKPAFMDDINQLLIGPLFVIAEIYFLLGRGKVLDKNITEKAVEKRRIFERKKAQEL